jgi:hypothetical protein
MMTLTGSVSFVWLLLSSRHSRIWLHLIYIAVTSDATSCFFGTSFTLWWLWYLKMRLLRIESFLHGSSAYSLMWEIGLFGCSDISSRLDTFGSEAGRQHHHSSGLANSYVFKLKLKSQDGSERNHRLTCGNLFGKPCITIHCTFWMCISVFLWRK